MRKASLLTLSRMKSLRGIITGVLLLVVSTISFAAGKQITFNNTGQLSVLVQMLNEFARQENVNIVLKADTDPNLTVNVTGTLDEIIGKLASQAELSFWHNGDSIYIGVKDEVTKPAGVDYLALLPNPVPPVKEYDTPAIDDVPLPPVNTTKRNKPVIKRVDLKYISTAEICYMLGIKSSSYADTKQKRSARKRIEVLLGSPGVKQLNGPLGDQLVHGDDTTLPTALSSYAASSINNTLTNAANNASGQASAWYSGAVNNLLNKGSLTESNQIYQQQPYQQPYGQQQNPYGQQQNPYGQQQYNPYGQQQNPYGQQQYNPYGQQQNPYGQQQYNPYGQQQNPYGQQQFPFGQQPIGTNPLNPSAPTTGVSNANQGGDLAAFMPPDIDEVLGLVGLNALLVKGKSQESLDQFEDLIKWLDQPVKQCIVEVMFVQTSVKEAMSLGSSFEFAGMPFSMVHTGGGNEGDFSARYVKGNLRVAISSLQSEGKAKIVNNPRVVVQNGGTASFLMDDSVPFVLFQNEPNVITGDTTQIPIIEMETFTQGLTVQEVTIHPDDSVTLRVDPKLETPGAGIPIPGGIGELHGGSRYLIDTIVRVKNGETIMMGGFVGKTEVSQLNKVPLLYNIPIIGPMLFGTAAKSKDDTETLIFITPTILRDDQSGNSSDGILPALF
ncbi:MAG: type II and III secretion system protein [bacterium]